MAHSKSRTLTLALLLVMAVVFCAAAGADAPMSHPGESLSRIPGSLQVLYILGLLLLATLVVLLLQNLRQRRGTATALRESEQWLRAILDTLPVGVLIIDAATHEVIHANPHAAEAVGESVHDMVDRPSQEFICTPKAQTSHHGDGRSLSIHEECTLRMADGRSIPVLTTVTRARLQDRDILLEVFLDISERKRVEEEKRSLQDELWQAQKMEAVGQLARGIAHDFNNLLQAMEGYTEMAMQHLGPAHPMTDKLGHALKACDRAATLVEKLRTFSQRVPLVQNPLDLNTAIDNARDSLSCLVGPGIRIEFKRDPDLWMVMADPVQIEQILATLCTNAREAMPDGGQLIIETRNTDCDAATCQSAPPHRHGQYACISVTDTGCGIAAEDIDRVFAPFFSTRQGAEGAGLGLATASAIVSNHKGYITADSTLGKGATFNVFFPLTTSPEPPEAESAKETPTEMKGSETILVAEDEELVRDVATSLLEEAGYNILEACDGDETVKVFREHPHDIDLVLLDVVMPKKTGPVVYRILKDINPNVRTIYCSGHSYDTLDDSDHSVPLIHKPYRAKELLRAVKDALADDG
jgi:PAS domain S-box-containing protein